MQLSIAALIAFVLDPSNGLRKGKDRASGNIGHTRGKQKKQPNKAKPKNHQRESPVALDICSSQIAAACVPMNSILQKANTPRTSDSEEGAKKTTNKTSVAETQDPPSQDPGDHDVQKVTRNLRNPWVSVQDVVLNSLEPSTLPSQPLPELSHFYTHTSNRNKEGVLLMSLWFLLLCHALTQKMMRSRQLTSFCQLHKSDHKNTCLHKKSLHQDMVCLFK